MSNPSKSSTDRHATSVYPSRKSFHAHRLTRLLFNSCAAQGIGHHAMLLIIHVEDDKRYQGAVTFWNPQLSEALGFKSPKQLTEARHKAIEAGWLHYHRYTYRGLGYYWSMIPASVEAEFIHSEIGTNETPIHSADGTQSGTNEALIHSVGGKPPTLNPKPYTL